MNSTDQPEPSTVLSNMAEDSTVTPLLSNAQLITVYSYLLPVAVAVGFLGFLTNILNVATFFKMGFASITNVNFFTLSVADLVCAAYTTASLTLLHPMVDDIVMNFSLLSLMSVLHIVYLSASAFGSGVTAVICVHRVLCIACPLKVRRFFTPRINKWVLVLLALYQVLAVIPGVLSRRLGSFDYNDFKDKFQTTVSATSVNYSGRAVYFFYSADMDMNVLSSFLSFSLPSSINFIIVVVGTCIQVIKFVQRKRMRAMLTISNVDRESNLIITVLVVCITYIASSVFICLLFVLAVAYPKFKYDNPYLQNAFMLFFTVSMFLQMVSYSVNFFVYFSRMTRYREQFGAQFNCGSPRIHQNTTTE